MTKEWVEKYGAQLLRRHLRDNLYEVEPVKANARRGVLVNRLMNSKIDDPQEYIFEEVERWLKDATPLDVILVRLIKPPMNREKKLDRGQNVMYPKGVYQKLEDIVQDSEASTPAVIRSVDRLLMDGIIRGTPEAVRVQIPGFTKSKGPGANVYTLTEFDEQLAKCIVDWKEQLDESP